MLAAATRRVLDIVSWVVVSLTVAFAIGIFVLPQVLGWQLMTVLSGSMEPNLSVGSIAVVAPVETDDIRQGDVITFTTGDRKVTHRVVEVRETSGARSFVTKGDANRTVDTKQVPQSAVLGKVRGDVPLAGYAFEYVKTPLGLAVLATVVAWLLISSALFGKRSSGRKADAVHRRRSDCDPEALTVSGARPIERNWQSG